MTDTTAMYAEIVKHERDANGDLVVYGRATGPDLDLDRQICDPDWLKTAMPEWFKVGNLREQHSSIAAGVGQEIKQLPDGGWDLKALVVDQNSARKVERGVLKGYSIGIRGPKVVKDASAPGGRICGGSIIEVSLVDRPANPSCTLTLAKALKPGPLSVTPGTVDFERSLVKVEELHEDVADASDFTGTVNESRVASGLPPVDSYGRPTDIEKRDFSAAERREASTLADGSFPLKSRQDVKNAIRLAGNAKDPAKAKRHIISWCNSHGCSDMIPDSWKSVDPDLLAELDELTKGLDLVAVRKGDKRADVRNAKKAIALISALIQSEAVTLADDADYEACDIELLLSAARSLHWFICREKKEPTVAHVDLADQPDTEKSAAPDAADTEKQGKPFTKPADEENDGEDEDDEETTDGKKKPAGKKKTPPASKAAEADADEQDDDLTELVKALSAEVSELKGELTKAMNAPAPGGPVLTRTTETTAKAESKENHLDKAAHWERLAYEVTDPTTRAGYLQMAATEKAAATS